MSAKTNFHYFQFMLIACLCAAGAVNAQGPGEADVTPGSASAGGFDGWIKSLESGFFEWPKYSVLRFQEDYAGVVPSRAQDRRDLFDALKHIPIDQAGNLWLSFGGQARLRLEGFNNFSFGAPAMDDDGAYLLTRAMLHAEVNLTERFRLFVEGKSALVEDRDLIGGRRMLDQDSLDLQNAFAEINFELPADAALILRGGRQEFLFGRQRLISPLDWANTRRTFDGASAIVRAGRFALDLFYAKPVLVDQYDFNEPNEHEDFWGAYSTLTNPLGIGTSFDAYLLGKHVHLPEMPTSDRITLGGRAWGKLGELPMNYEVEGGVQVGEVGDREISAGFLASELSLTLSDVTWKPWFALGFEISSGDDDPNDGEINTFDQLHPLGHAYHGFIDIVGRQNIIDFSHSVRLTPHERFWLKLDGHALWRESTMDALYNAGGGLVRPGGAGTPSYIGYELDFTTRWIIDHHTDLFAGYSHFFAEDFIEATGAHDDIDFWYLQMTFTF